MKQYILLSYVLVNSVVVVAQGNVGINTTPHSLAQLHVETGTSTTKGFLITGKHNIPASVPDLPVGSYFFYYPGKAAIRAGEINGTQWHNSNVGHWSVAMGDNTMASAGASTAFGSNTVASGGSSTAFGYRTLAAGTYATATGAITKAMGYSSASLGLYTISKGAAATVVGIYNDSLLSEDEVVAPSVSTPLFMVGNGDAHDRRSNAFVVRKDGRVGIGNIVPQYTLDVANRMRIRYGGTASTTAGIWLNKSNNTEESFVGMYNDNHVGFYSNTAGWGLLMNTQNGRVGIGTTTPATLLHVDAGSNTANGLLVTGSYNNTAVLPSLGAGSRLMFYPGKAALRAGSVNSTQWDNINIGHNSVAFGSSTVASGAYSIATGQLSRATNDQASAFGWGADASGNSSMATGISTHASGQGATAMGHVTNAKGFASLVIGMFNDSLLTSDELMFARSATSPLFIVGNGDASHARSNAFVVQKDGKVGVGNIVPQYTLDVQNRMRIRYGGNANATAGVWFNKANNTEEGFIGMFNDNNLGFYGNSGAGWGLTMNTVNGNVGIGTTTPTQKLYVVGNIFATGTISPSDIRYKTNVQPVTGALAAVMNLHPIYYDWKQAYKDKGFGNQRQVGFSAQEVEHYFPEMVQTDAEGFKAIDYSRMTPVLLQALKELKKENDLLKQDVETLKLQVAELIQKVKK